MSKYCAGHRGNAAVLRAWIGLWLIAGFTACGGDAGGPDAGNGKGGGLGDDASMSIDEPVCGDGDVEGTENCDDGNTEDGDGCSADCRHIEMSGDDCVSTDTCPDMCGNGGFDPGETCDDGNRDDGDGCSATCKVEMGFGCARPGSECVTLPVCGNGVRERGEECDSGPASDPGCSSCKIQTGFFCAAPGQACVEQKCGNKVRTPEEDCDDGNVAGGDGCSQSCEIESGWRCSAGSCRPICGDKVLKGNETCEDGNTLSGDGCSAGCRTEPGASCGTLGAACGDAVCGNSQVEGGEGCDDGNLIGGDGCGPTCQSEPQVTVGPNPVVQTKCGDGLVTSGEACDDGNAANGDGCSATCKVETGFTCTETLEYPDSVKMKVTYRDFKDRDETGGHPHMRHNDNNGPGLPSTGDDLGIVGTVCNALNGASCGRLDTDGKPQLSPGNHTTVSTSGSPNHPEAFALWYRDTNTDDLEGEHGVIQIGANPSGAPAGGDAIALVRDMTTNAYSFDSDVTPTPSSSPQGFYPLNGRGFGKTHSEPTNNFHFTTELRSFFQYKGGETLTFFGDDDVWVFINGRLAVDIGGIHGKRWGRVVLGDDGAGSDSTCTVGGVMSTPAACELSDPEKADNEDTRFGLVKGNVYEIALFNAERHPTGSNFRLTLSGFLAPRSYCTPKCGDGIVAGWETCDSGTANANGKYGVCNTTCSAMEYCGDGVVQAGHEACDNGFNQDLLYTSGSTNACAPGCVLPPACGDGMVQAPYELCDDGAMNDDAKYGGCTTKCDWGPYCGDGNVDPGEMCDEGANNVAGDQAGRCGYDCQPAFILL